MKKFTLISCSYNTPKVTLNMLRSFKQTNSPCHLILMENSTDDLTSNLLDENKIKYIKNPGGGHSPSVQTAFDMCQTDYVLLVDTDVLFFENLDSIFNEFVQSGDIIWGEFQPPRGGYNLVDRINPWFCFIDLKKTKEHGILFHDQEIVERSMSHKFFRQPLKEPVDRHKLYYDVGSSFLESAISKGLTYRDIRLQPTVFRHFEGMSWRKKDEEHALQIMGVQTEIDYGMFVQSLNYESISLEGFFL